MDYKNDIRSYECRIRALECDAEIHLKEGNYERLLVDAANLIALRQGLGEVHYQAERSERQ